MKRSLTSIFLIAFIGWVDNGRAAAGDPALLDLRVAEGDGVTYAPGSRATRGISVLVTDEKGKPVEGAIVSFALPFDGPSGVFASGGRTEIAKTKADGQASVWGMRWNQVVGPFEIHVIAVKGQARTGATLTQYLAAEASPGSTKASSKLPGGGIGGHKWLWIGLAGVAVAGAAGFAAKGSSGSGAPGSAAVSAAGVQIGTPTITLGHP